ncbi:MAG: ABC transporter ATP-binding protein [Anaerolineales bacterium]|nr:ABC transporter ATP-binding protein [Anaerolineales bacterium]
MVDKDVKKPTTTKSDALLDVRRLQVSFETTPGLVRAVNEVSFTLNRGEVLALIGESGSGKSVTALTVMGAMPSNVKQAAGEIWFQGQNLLSLSPTAMRHIRGNRIAMVPQDPMIAFDPVYPIGVQIAEAIRAHQSLSHREAHERAVALLDQVGLPNAARRAAHFPHQLSGGMAQRALIAMALACGPDILIADEPTTALDVTVQAQILELLMHLKETMGLAVLFITHDMGVAAQIADRVAVMYAGRIVEQAEVDALFYRPQHPYTWGLLQSTLRVDDASDAEIRAIAGAPPSPVAPPPGCAFHPRCPWAKPICREAAPALATVAPNHVAGCHLPARERQELSRG